MELMWLEKNTHIRLGMSRFLMLLERPLTIDLMLSFARSPLWQTSGVYLGCPFLKGIGIILKISFDHAIGIMIALRIIGGNELICLFLAMKEVFQKIAY